MSLVYRNPACLSLAIVLCFTTTACMSSAFYPTPTAFSNNDNPNPSASSFIETLKDVPTSLPTIFFVDIPTEGGGAIAARIVAPSKPRYPEGAGVVVDVPTFFTPADGFTSSIDIRDLGLIYINFLWPGCRDSKTLKASSGVQDYGGESSTAALRDVIRFATGELADLDGRFLADVVPIPVKSDNVGLYAFSHPGIAAYNVLNQYGDSLRGLGYYVGRENPTIDSISAMELGYFGDDGKPVFNTLYAYPESYRKDDIPIDYSTVRWDPTYPASPQGYSGRPYFDLDQNRRRDPTDHVLGSKTPAMFGKRFYSVALTEALAAGNSFAEGEWPSDLATPEEARAVWSIREAAGGYAAIGSSLPNLKVMMLFGVKDHVQVLRDKPHIHQAWDGYYKAAGLWTRLNPDAAYADCFYGNEGKYADHPAGVEPGNWMNISSWGYPNDPRAIALFPLAAIAEMADRTYRSDWDADISSVLAGDCG